MSYGIAGEAIAKDVLEGVISQGEVLNAALQPRLQEGADFRGAGAEAHATRHTHASLLCPGKPFIEVTPAQERAAFC